jgi:predicted GNAT superfamily acetyltransferase
MGRRRRVPHGTKEAAVTVELDPVRSHDEYRAVEQLQRDVWRLEEAEIVPDHVLITAHKNGGLVVGAFEPLPEGGRQLVGFVFGFVGLTPDREVKHCSHMLGVASTHQDRSIGYRLKLAQREHVISQGLPLVTWTFDPLESRNANLNFHKLGATCETYLRDLYGDMRDELNVGLPSDRFQVAWHITSDHVAERLQRKRAPGSGEAGASVSALLSRGVRILNRFSPAVYPCPPEDVEPIEGEQVLVQIPAHFHRIRWSDVALARAWREQTRALFEAAFAAGYTVVDLLFEEGRSCYLLTRDWTLA